MTTKEISEIRRRLNIDKNCISHIYGCYVNKNREIVSKIESSMALLPLSESEKYLTLLKKTLSGTIGKNLIDLDFSTHQVTDEPEHKLLMDLRESDLTDNDARDKLYNKIIESVFLPESSYLILLALDKYDVPEKSSEDALEITEKTSSTVFKYFVCGICPVKEGKSELGYFAKENEFHSCTPPHTVCPPVLGFMFPSFDDRTANIYKTVLYTKDSDIMQDRFIDTLFKTEVPMSATEQKNTFSEALASSLESECSFDVVQAVHEQIRERITEHKESKSTEPLELGANEVASILKITGVAEDKIEGFKAKCSETFKKPENLNPTNIIDVKKFDIVTPAVKISVDPDYTYIIETKTINGIKYILIPAEDGVKINGVDVNINE